MKFILNGLRVSLGKESGLTADMVAKEINLPQQAVRGIKVLRESVDARKKMPLAFVYSLELEISASERQIERALLRNPNLKKVRISEQTPLQRGDTPLRNRPVVIGTGPAGYFAALTLAKYGYAPLVLERGADVDARTELVKSFWQGGELDVNCNVQFGEGGAGTFSDGKLTTRINDARITSVLNTFVESGAAEEILYKHKPHVGTDKLRFVVKNLRRQIESYGGEVRFRAQVTGLKVENGRVAGVVVNESEEVPADIVVLAIGHSARDTYIMLQGLGVQLEAKSFAIGLRVEHPQSVINEAQFGEYADDPRLGAADYQFAYQDRETGRGAYAFCMCPGGKVVAATSEKGQVVTNGMSEFARNTGIANSALVVTVNPHDFPTPEPVSGIEFQRHWEKQAFKLGGKNYHAPAQSVVDFLADKASSDLALNPSYLPGVEPVNLHEALPKEIGEVLVRAIKNFDRKINGFISEQATLTGVETRTSAPVRIVRNESFESVNLPGLYPTGEGAGYAGGIMSAAVDGLKVAEMIIAKYYPTERRN